MKRVATLLTIFAVLLLGAVFTAPVQATNHGPVGDRPADRNSPNNPCKNFTSTSSPTYAQCLDKEFPDKNKKADSTANKVDPVSQQKVKDTSVIGYVNAVYKWAAIIGGLLAVLMLTYAGYRYMTSYGDPEKIASAKEIIEQALIGLVLLILAAVILQTINPNTTGCKKNCGDIDFSKPTGLMLPERARA